MAERRAYPDIPLFRYDYTDLSEAAVSTALRPAALAGPTSRSDADDLGSHVLRFVAADGTIMDWRFLPGRRVAMGDSEAGGYGALTLGNVTLIAHLMPQTPRGYAIAWNRADNLATVIELWFGGGPAPTAREVNRAIWHGHIGAGPDSGAGFGAPLHEPTARCEGRAVMWREDTGNRTIDYYPSAAFSHWVELDRMEEGRGYSAPSDYIKLTEDLYLYTRTEAEFSGLWHMYVMDANRLQSVGLRLGFNGLDELEFYMFRGTGEWLGQIARFEEFGDVSGDPLKIEGGVKGERRVYRPLETMDKMTPAQVAEVVASDTHVFDRESPMAGHGLPITDHLVGRSFSIAYDGGPAIEYRFTTGDSLEYRLDGGAWTQARYNAWESAPGVYMFGHLIAGASDHDCHIVVVDLESGMATSFNGYLNTPYFANEAGCRTLFGSVSGNDVRNASGGRHQRTTDLLGSAFTWSYSPGLTSMHLYSSPNTVSWIIFTPDGHGGAEWSGSGDFVKIRDQLYFVRWQEEACNGTLGCILINMRTMHDVGIGYHCGKNGLSLGPVGAYARHAGKFDVDRFLADKKGGYAV